MTNGLDALSGLSRPRLALGLTRIVVRRLERNEYTGKVSVMRAVVVCRFPIYRDALAKLVGSAFGPDPAEGYAALQDALDRAAVKPVDMMVVELTGEDPEFRD